MKLRSSTLPGCWFIVLILLCSSTPAAATAPTDLGLEKQVPAELGELTPAEKRLLRSVTLGGVAWGGDSTDYSSPQNDPANAALYTWPADRKIRADLIRWLCIQEIKSKTFDPAGIQITGAWIDNVLDLSHLEIPIPLLLTKCYIPAGIKLEFADIPLLVLSGSWTGPISGKGLSVRGDLILSNGFHSTGQVDLYGAKIGGELFCADATFSNPGETTLSLALSNIAGELQLTAGFYTDGVVKLEGARIGADLVVDTATFSGSGQNGLNASGATISGTFFWTNVSTTNATTLSLSFSKVGILQDDQKSWPRPGNIYLDGFVYNSISGESPQDVRTRLDWIALQPYGFRPQPYQQLAKAFRENGQEVESRQVLIAKESAMMRDVALSPISRKQPASAKPYGFLAVFGKGNVNK